MRVFITGSDRGQLHWELLRSCPATIEIIGVTPRLDLCELAGIAPALEQLQPDAIINVAAYTAVDKAEAEPEIAATLNTHAVEQLARSAAVISARVVHVSTDFVFGASDGAPFATDAPKHPVSVYGKTKLAGEQALLQELGDLGTVVRTAWVYSSNGNNFVKTMLRLMRERGEVGVIADQTGSPTWAHTLAKALWHALEVDCPDVLHWTGAGVASWYDFAVAIAEEATLLGLLDRDVIINPLTTSQYPTSASRPSYSVLQLTETWKVLGMTAPHWRTELRAMLEELT